MMRFITTSPFHPLTVALLVCVVSSRMPAAPAMQWSPSAGGSDSTLSVAADSVAILGDTVRDLGGVNTLRFALVSAAAVSTLGASYWAVKNSWWSEQPSAFHFDAGPDLKYALNLDKAAHFFGGAIGADAFSDAMQWARMERRDALLYGAGFSSFVQLAMEVKDGFAPRWGFSPWDVGCGMAGSLYPFLQDVSPVFRHIDLKMSYWKRSNRYYEYNPHGTWNDDYVNQTYWLSFGVHHLLPRTLRPWWPAFLAIAVGAGIDETTDGGGGGKVELYLALDVDVRELIPTTSPFWRGVLHYLNYVKFPAPAIRIAPGIIWYGVYF